jgi:Xaa-Pro aminopeptidase
MKALAAGAAGTHTRIFTMHRLHREQAARLLDSLALDGALLASPASVTWLTGYTAPVQVGPSVFAGGPPLLWF